ncbi:MAG: hypothetical protein ABFD90_05785 [Phycisphaerales bacterium]
MIHMRWIRLACVVLFVVGFAWAPVVIGASAVEELTKRMPDDVIAFAGTSGGDVLKGDFEKTALGRIWNDQGVRTFYQSIKKELLAKAVEESGDPNVSEKVDLVLKYVQLALSRPIVIGAAQVPVEDGPPIGGFAILDAGSRKAEFTAMLSKLEAMAGEDGIADKEIGDLKLRGPKDSDVPVYWGWVDNCFVIGLNDAKGAAVKYLSQPRSVTSASLAKVPGSGDALVITADVQRVRQLVGSIIREESGDEDANLFTSVVKSLGFNDVKACCIRAGFAGPDVVVNALLEAPTPATGVFANCKPIDPAWFGAVDVRAVTASAVNWDLAGLYDTIMNAVKTALPDEVEDIQQGIGEFESEAKLRIREELLASLAGPMVSYTLPAGAMVEAPMGGLVIAAKLKDAQAFEKAMTALGEFIVPQAEGMLQISEQKQDDGRTVHVWTIAPVAMMGLMPTWSVSGDHVVIASGVELCNLGVNQLASKGADGKSLLDAEGYKKVAAGLPQSLSSLSYVDSAVQFKQVMTQAQQFWPMATMLAMQQGVKLPAMLPSLTHIIKDLGPSVDYCYAAPDGLRSLYRGPGIEVSLATVAGGVAGVGVAMPALARAREQARTVASMSNLKQLGLAVIMYADDHDGKTPSDLEQAKPYYRDSKILESPRKPDWFDGPSYIYIPDQTTAGNVAGNIVAYENPEFGMDKVLVLFLDGHVEAMDHDRFQSELEATYERLGREMPGEESEEEVVESEEEEDAEDEDESEEEEESEEESDDEEESEDEEETEEPTTGIAIWQLP